MSCYWWGFIGGFIFAVCLGAMLIALEMYRKEDD